MVEVPRRLPTIVPPASEANAASARGSRPCFISPARLVTPSSVPMVSNMSTISSTTTAKIQVGAANRPPKSTANSVGRIEGGAEITPVNSVRPNARLRTPDAPAPMSSAPGTRRMTRMAVTTSPASATWTGRAEMSPGPM